MRFVDENNDTCDRERQVFDDEFSCKGEDGEVRHKDDRGGGDEGEERPCEVEDEDDVGRDPPAVHDEAETDDHLEHPQELEPDAGCHKRNDRIDEIKNWIVTGHLEKPE